MTFPSRLAALLRYRVRFTAVRQSPNHVLIVMPGEAPRKMPVSGEWAAIVTLSSEVTDAAWVLAESAGITPAQAVGYAVLAVHASPDYLIPHAPTPSIETLCEVIHDAYEAAAVTAGWQTQEQSRKPWAGVPEENKATMRVAVRALVDRLGVKVDDL